LQGGAGGILSGSLPLSSRLTRAVRGGTNFLVADYGKTRAAQWADRWTETNKQLELQLSRNEQLKMLLDEALARCERMDAFLEEKGLNGQWQTEG